MLTQEQIKALNAIFPHVLGSEFSRTKNVVVGLYDIAIQGGAVGTTKILDPFTNQPLRIPANALFGVPVDFAFDVLDGLVSGGTTEISLGLEAPDDLIGNVEIGFLSSPGISPYSYGAPVKTTAEQELTMTISTDPLVAGKFLVFLEYLLSPEV